MSAANGGVSNSIKESRERKKQEGKNQRGKLYFLGSDFCCFSQETLGIVLVVTESLRLVNKIINKSADRTSLRGVHGDVGQFC